MQEPYSGTTTVSGGTLQLPPFAGGGDATFAGTITNGPSPPRPNAVISGVLTLTGTNTYTGGTIVNGSTLLGSWGVDTAAAPLSLNGSGTVTLSADSVTFTDANSSASGTSVAPSPGAAIAPIPKGPVFYIVTEGAGLGDSVRTVPCTGSETVMSAVGAIGGISQVSGTKIWIARPMPHHADKSTILNVDWEAISKRGINATNYTLMHGDRLVFGEDPQTTQSNLLSEKTSPIERVNGVVGLTASTLRGVQDTPGAKKLIKELIEKNLITDDDQLKNVILDAIREQKIKDGGAKAAEKPTSSSEAGKPLAIDGTVTLVLQAEPQKSNSAVSNGFLYLGYRSVPDEKKAKTPPHEHAMQPLPAYRIEPPDVISVEMLKLIPKPPYRAAIFDVLKITANAPPDKPIDNNFVIEADGSVDLGPLYGKVRVTDMTISEMNAALDKHLKQYLTDPRAYVQLARISGAQPVTGQYLVGPDGTINLRKYGLIPISGKTVAEAKAGIEERLKKFLDSPEVSVDVLAYNSKVYFMITQGAGLGDSVRRLPSTGNDTVLDAISQINGLSQVSDSKRIWIVRPSPSDAQKATVLQVDWHAITRRGETATNYQIFPRDRVYIGEDAQLTGTNLIAKKTAPIERAMGIISLTTSTLQSLSGTPGGAAAVNGLVKRGVFDNDPEVKQIVEETIRLGEEASKSAAKPPADGKTESR